MNVRTEKLKTVPSDLLLQLRKLLPKQRMTYGQARIVAELQAARARQLVGATTTRLSLEWIEHIPGVSVTMASADEMEGITKSPAASGATKVLKDGSYHIYIGDNHSVTHCRFTLAHELFHVVTGPFEADIFGDFGHGDPELHRTRIERVADHFAANLLMPKTLVKRVWGLPIQQLSSLAAEFGVSEDAMRIRLKTIGIMRSGLTKEMFYREPRTAAATRLGSRGPGKRTWFRCLPTTRDSRLFLRNTAASAEERPPNHDFSETSCPGAVLTVAEAARQLRVSRWSLYGLIRRQQLKTFKIGRRRLIAASAINDLIEQLQEAAE